MNWPFDDLEDDPAPPPPTIATNARGRPKIGILDQLTIACHTKSTNASRVRCAGEGCHESWAVPRQSGRILPHSSTCRYLDNEMRGLALMENAKASLSYKLDGGASEKPDAFAAFRRAGTEGKAEARKARTIKTNLLVVNLLCDAAVAPSLIDKKSFRAFADHLEPGNDIAVATTFSTNYIPAEAANVTVQSLAHLKQCDNLTISYDGGTTRGQQSIYTVHVTTPEREAHLIAGDESSGFSHTGEHIKKVLMGVRFLRPYRYIY